MSNGIQKYSFIDLKAMSEEVAKSGLFAMTPPQILTLMLLSESTGLHPIQALTRYHIIEGRPAMRSDAMQALFQADGGRIEWVKDTDDQCEAIFYHPEYCKQGKAVSFTMGDARRAGVGDRPTWKRHPRSMLRARVITNGIRMIDPGVITGIYTPDEIEDIDITPTPSPSERTAHASLQTKLRSRVKPAEHQPVANVVQELKAAEAATEAAPNENGDHVSEKSEFRAWVEDALAGVYAELRQIAEADPNNLAARVRIPAGRVANHVINEGIEAGRVNERAILNASGKRDKDVVAATVNALWDDDAEWCMDVVGKYLAKKVINARGTKTGGHDEDEDQAA